MSTLTDPAATSGTPCSLQSWAVGEPLAGTAPTARAWIVLEHPGPWGRDAVADSDLPEPVRTTLARAKALQITVLLARRPGRRDETARRVLGHRVWVARCAAGGTRLRTGVLANLDVVAQWDLAAIAEGQLPPLDTAVAQPLMLVCTHGRRDACCAVNGRALINGLFEQATAEQRERIWECSHVGGHRFAPVVVTLPDGMVHGRLSVDDGVELLDRTDTGLVLPKRLRGRSCLAPPLQAAEIAVRRAERLDGAQDLDALAVIDERVVPVPPVWQPGSDRVTAEVRHVDGRSWQVAVRRDDRAAGPRAESCGGEPTPVTAWLTDTPHPVHPWR